MNSMIISGNLGRDMEVRYTQNQKAIGSFPLPVKQGYGEHEKTSWVEVKILGDRAQKLQPYLVKGKEVTVSGEFVYEQWEKDGVKTGRPVLIMNHLDMHGGAQSQQSQPAQHSNHGQPAQSSQAPANSPADFDSFDDIPF